MKNARSFYLIPGLLAALLVQPGSVSAQAAAAKGKGLGHSSGRGTPSQRAGIPPEAFGSPVASPDKSRWAWIADLGEGPNVFVGSANRKKRTQVTRYKFTATEDLMPGLPILWSPDGRRLAYYEYSHSAKNPTESSHAVVVRADTLGEPLLVKQPGGNLDTRPSQWLSPETLRFKGLREASMQSGEDAFVMDLNAGLAQTETDWLAAQAAARLHADSVAAAARQSAPAKASGK